MSPYSEPEQADRPRDLEANYPQHTRSAPEAPSELVLNSPTADLRPVSEKSASRSEPYDIPGVSLRAARASELLPGPATYQSLLDRQRPAKDSEAIHHKSFKAESAAPDPEIKGSKLPERATSQAPDDPNISRYSSWDNRNSHDPWEGFGGIPRTAKFMAADDEMTVLVFRRFHELAIRNLLNLQARVAALEGLQRSLDIQARKKLQSDDDFWELAADPRCPSIITSQMSYEEFAVVGCLYGDDVRGPLPRAVIKNWQKLKPRLPVEDAPHDDSEVMTKGTGAWSGEQQPASVSKPPRQAPSADEEDVQLRWETALAYEQALKDYRKTSLFCSNKHQN
jgi:hypothetical protein